MDPKEIGKKDGEIMESASKAHQNNSEGDASAEPIEVKLIIACSDGDVHITPEKVERVKKVLASLLKAKEEEVVRKIEDFKKYLETDKMMFEQFAGAADDHKDFIDFRSGGVNALERVIKFLQDNQI